MRFRPATLEDLDMLLAWRNDAETRRWSRNTRRIEKEEHSLWFESLISNPDIELMMVEHMGDIVGSTRFEYAHEEVTLSWTVAPERRGCGLGKKMLVQALDRVCLRAIAIIHKDNLASLKMASNAGFSVFKTDGNWITCVQESRKLCKGSRIKQRADGHL